MSYFIEELAFLTVQKELQSKKEISLDNINCGITTVQNPAFIDESGHHCACITRKFNSITQIKEKLDNLSLTSNVFVYKLYELSEYGKNLEPTGNKFYHLKYCVRSIISTFLLSGHKRTCAS